MKKHLFFLFLLPTVAFAQPRFYYSVDGRADFGKFLEYTGYGLLASANAHIAPRLYAGLSAGAVQVKPFIKNPAFPVMARLTFFTTADEEKLMPFGLFEAGKLFYSEEGFGGSPAQTMQGDFSYFTGVGVRLHSHRRTHWFFGVGLAGYNFHNRSFTGTSAYYDRPYHYQRIAVRAGMMLPR